MKSEQEIREKLQDVNHKLNELMSDYAVAESYARHTLIGMQSTLEWILQDFSTGNLQDKGE